MRNPLWKKTALSFKAKSFKQLALALPYQFLKKVVRLMKRVDLVNQTIYIFVKMGVEVFEVFTGFHTGFYMGYTTNVAAMHRKDGSEQVLYIL